MKIPSDTDFVVNWAELNNAVFARIYADRALRERYDLANAVDARAICSDVFDALVEDANDFVERFIVVR